MDIKNLIVNSTLAIIDKFIAGKKEKIYDIFFRYFPVRLFYLLEDTYSAYLKIYLPKKDDIVIDAGAFIGNFSVLASRLVGKNGRVIAFEPDKIVADKLRKRVKKMKLNNIIVVNKGLGKTNKKITAYSNRPGELSLTYKQKNSAIQTINLTSIDSFLEKHKIGKVNFIKMDIEGAEIEAIKGAIKTIKKCFPCFAIASYHILGSENTSSRLEKMFKKFKYQVVFTGNNKHLTTYAKK